MPATTDALHRRRRRWGTGMLATFWLILTLMPPVHVRAFLPVYRAHVEGKALDAHNGRPIAGAQVALLDLGLSAVTDTDGRFAWRNVPLSSPVQAVTVTVAAAGYAAWTIQNVRLLADDTLILTAQLSDVPTRITVPTEPPARPNLSDLDEARAFTGNQMNLPLPTTIRVRVTNYPYCDLNRPYTVQVIDFRTYLQHVLPNEWIPTWHKESLRAGAMAAKTYAWYWVARGGKWPDADVYDSTCDQYYNPAVAYTSTNAAIEATWNWRLTRNGMLIHASYRTYYWMCAAAGLAGNCMGIVDSHNMAKQGYTWPAILRAFYADSRLSPIAMTQRRFFPLTFFDGL